MKSKKPDSSNKAKKEDVSKINILTQEDVEKLTKGAKAYEGILQVRKRAYLGQIKYQYWWGNGGGMFYCYATEYTINDPDNQRRHKANIHFSFDSLQWWGKDSPDSMRQDNKWNAWAVGGYIAANSRARVYVEFIFDLPFQDEKGESSIYYTYP